MSQTLHDATTDAAITACFPVMRQLRPHLREEDWVATVRRLEGGGYRLTYVEEGGHVRAVAGWRLLEMLATGPQLYVDDLVTDEASRSRGHGECLLRHLREVARAHGCTHLELDSATHRHRAHRFYFREGMHILGFHFSQKLTP
jgi:GNAT superfamily N-acetyltransferase